MLFEGWRLRRAVRRAVGQYLDGKEAVTVDAARRRRLDTRAAINFTLLAWELMNRSPRIAEHLQLKTVQEDEQLGKELLAKDPRSAAGLCQRGIQADPFHFGAMLGSGAA